MADQKYIAVDLGAESGRVLVGSFDGKCVQLEEAHRFLNTSVRVNGTLHWDVLRLWRDIQEGIAAAAQKFGGDFAGIGVDTWGVDFGLLDESGALLGNPVHYRDSRTDGMMERAFETVPRSEIFERTGLQFMSLNTLFQLLAMKEQNAPQLGFAKTLLFMPDLLNYWLTGRKAAEYSIASTSQMLDAKTRNWDEQLLEKFGLPPHILPEIIPPGTVLGNVREELATALKLDANTPVIAPGCHDTASAVAAVPASGENWAYLSSGTWSLMGIELDEPLISERVAELNFTNEGGAGGKIRFLKNIAGLWLVQECRRAFAKAGTEYSYAELTEMASAAPAFGAFIEPDDESFVAPENMPDAIMEFCKRTRQQPPQSEGAFVRCALESLALKYRWVLEKLEELRGAKIEVLHIVGGGTQNKLLSRLTADAIGRTVVTGPVEATAVGNILVQAMARGVLSDLDQVRDVVKNSFELENFDPDTHDKKRWELAYQRYLELQDL